MPKEGRNTSAGRKDGTEQAVQTSHSDVEKSEDQPSSPRFRFRFSRTVLAGAVTFRVEVGFWSVAADTHGIRAGVMWRVADWTVEVGCCVTDGFVADVRGQRRW